MRGKRGALYVAVNLDDLIIVMAVSVFVVTMTMLAPVWLMMIIAGVLALYCFLIWLDALLFVQYRIEINQQTLSWFITGSKGLSKGVPHLAAGLQKLPSAMWVPLFWPVVIFSFALNSTIEWLVVSTVSAFMLAVFNHKNWLKRALLVTFCIATFGLFYTSPELTVNILMFIGFVGVVFTLLLIAMRVLFQSQHPFLTSPTLLTNIMLDDTFEADDDIEIQVQHQAFVNPVLEKPKASELHGKLAGANIILITVESMGAYVSPYAKDAARSLLAERFENSSWLSKQHFCLCPNTTVSTNQMYTGNYSNNPYNKVESLYPGSQPKHIAHLKKAGYKTLFLDSADIGLYDYHKLLKRIGFDKVWGTADIPANGLKADYRLLNMVDVVADEVQQQPFFLHLINDQTHMPYEVIDKKRFNRHKGKDAKSTYLNALEEVDFIFNQFLDKLEAKIDLSNTMIVFTGDHGESFGEYGYSFHSNSVIEPQMHVPFMLNHAKLAAKTIEHSCHFDLFPTFFDLLGIDVDYPTLGTSIAHDDRDFAYFFHSATLKGNSPANFGFMLNGEMLWMDRLFNQVNGISPQQQKLSLQGAEKRYIKNLLYKMLESRSILS